MYSFEYPKDMNVGRVCLEMSLKPFKSLEQSFIEEVCTELFDQWKELLIKASGCSVLLWTADGSEILEYRGELDDEIEWARYLGLANPPDLPQGSDPQKLGLHSWPRYYMDNPPVITYGDLKRIIAALKRIGREITGFEITVGATFDPGPEFAKSDFKYNRHTEISKGSILGGDGSSKWVHCTSILKGDTGKYAAFPDGIPEGTHFGTFLGAQYRELAKDLGFDYIWFSNGFGFSRDSWNWTGECFDGKEFFDGAAERVKDQILEFWHKFTEACPGVRIETRGSNLSTGMDIAAHGSPLSSIYEFLPFAPPNSPWAAIDAQFGLELVGYMSHIAETPSEGYLFRYYTHDPWWINSPWFDRYNRQPHDIYLPLSVARLDENLRVMQPYGINFLTADDSFGNLPRRCPVEVIPHLLDAYSHYPDAAGPVTWVYPFEQYHKIGFQKDRAGEVLFGDWFIKSAVDAGMPLNTVISASNFVKGDAARHLAGKTVLVMPVPDEDSDMEKAVLEALLRKGDVLLYGPADHASDTIKSLLGIETTMPLEGEFILESSLPEDKILQGGDPSRVLKHQALISGGGLNTIRAGSDVDILIKAVHTDGEERIYGVFNGRALSGRLAWVRGSFPGEGNPRSRLPGNFKASEYVMPGKFLRAVLTKFDIHIAFALQELDDQSPMVLYSMSENACYVTGYAPDTTCKMRLGLPDGAPIMMGTDCIVENSIAEYTLPRWWYNECRIFVRQKERSKVSCIIKPSVFPGTDRRFYVTGLRDADVIFRKVPGTIVKPVHFPCGSSGHGDADKFLDTNIEYEELDNNRILCRNISGSLMISWGTGETYKLVGE
jgi:hypothetical protein